MGSLYSPEKNKELEEDKELKKNKKRPDTQLDILLENSTLFQSNTKSCSEICKNSE
jgi:hypothetical protein